MARFFDALTPELTEFIRRQKLFFVASAAAAGRVNVSPKGLDTLRVLDDRTVAWLDLTGSGAETAAHVRENGRLTLMFCSFEGDPLILRLYGRGELVRPDAAGWPALARHFGDYPGVRQIVLLHVESLQTSCGAGVPLFDHVGERGELLDWLAKKGPEGAAEYRRRKNRVSIDGLATGFGEEENV